MGNKNNMDGGKAAMAPLRCYFMDFQLAVVCCVSIFHHPFALGALDQFLAPITVILCSICYLCRTAINIYRFAYPFALIETTIRI